MGFSGLVLERIFSFLVRRNFSSFNLHIFKEKLSSCCYFCPVCGETQYVWKTTELADSSELIYGLLDIYEEIKETKYQHFNRLPKNNGSLVIYFIIFSFNHSNILKLNFINYKKNSKLKEELLKKNSQIVYLQNALEESRILQKDLSQKIEQMEKEKFSSKFFNLLQNFREYFYFLCYFMVIWYLAYFFCLLIKNP